LLVDNQTKNKQTKTQLINFFNLHIFRNSMSNFCSFSWLIKLVQSHISHVIVNEKLAHLIKRQVLTVLDGGALQPQKWQLIGTGCSTVAQASACPMPIACANGLLDL